MRQQNYLITSALPYPNGPMHLGHISATYLPADIYSRFCKLMGRHTVNLWWTDDHGVAIEIAAQKQGISEDEVVTRQNQQIKNSMKKLDINCDIFSRTHIPTHQELAKHLFKSIQDNWYIEKRDEEQMYCNDCEKYLPDRYIEWTCPHCGYVWARGDQCESCGRMMDPTELKEAYCTICHGKNIVKKQTYNYYFLLSKFQKPLEKRIATKTNRKPNVLWVVKKRLKEWLHDRCVTRDIKRWISVPGDEKKKMYVWFEACFGYVSFLKQFAMEQWDMSIFTDIWEDKDSHTVHFIWKDNIVFHTIIWPALIMAYNGNIKLPDDVPAFEFLNLEGKKFSTSRNYAIWLHDIVEKYPSDVIRYYMTLIMPETKDSDFKRHEFMERNNELVNTLGNLVNRTITFAIKNFDGKLDWIQTELLSPMDIEILDVFKNIKQQFISTLDQYKFKDAINIVFDYLRDLNKYFNDRAPRTLKKENPQEAGHVMSITAIWILYASLLFSPFLPNTATKIFQWFGLDIHNFDFHNIEEIIDNFPFHLHNIWYLFNRIEEEDIARELEQL